MITTGSTASLKELYIDTTGLDMMPVKILGDYRENGASGFIDMGTFPADEVAQISTTDLEAVVPIFDSWKHPLTKTPTKACSCCIKKLDDGTVLMGRNMDLPISYSPAFIFRTKGNGKDTFDTVNIGYPANVYIPFDQIAETGTIPRMIAHLFAMAPSDVLNSEGLYLQINMRDGTDVPCSSTNPNAAFRTATTALTRLIGDRCATIEDVLDYLKTIDIFDPQTSFFDWSMAIGMMDRTGRYGVLEFVDNRIVWNEGRPGFACGQCNFFWDPEGARRCRIDMGFGRWQEMMEDYDSIQTREDMEKTMQHIWYSNMITDGSPAKDWKVDWTSEFAASSTDYVKTVLLKDIYTWREKYHIQVDEKELARVEEIAERQIRENIAWDDDYLRSPVGCYDLITALNLLTRSFAQLPNSVQKVSGWMECSTLSYVADTKNPGFQLHLFETNDVYHLGLYETTVERHPTTKVHGRRS